MNKWVFVVFSILLNASAAADCPAVVLPLNTVVSGDLSLEDCTVDEVLGNGDQSLADLYMITLSSSATATISMSSSSFDSFLRLHDEALTVIAQDDD